MQRGDSTQEEKGSFTRGRDRGAKGRDRGAKGMVPRRNLLRRKPRPTPRARARRCRVRRREVNALGLLGENKTKGDAAASSRLWAGEGEDQLLFFTSISEEPFNPVPNTQ